jgi:electron transfer flavoprotein beta subunit
MAVTLVVPIKAVPDVVGEPGFRDLRLLREGSLLLNDADENALEAALVAADTLQAEVVAVSAGPEDAAAPLRRALQLGAARAVHVLDSRIAGSDAPSTARVLAATIDRLQQEAAVPLVVTGASSVDATSGLVPGLLAGLLGRPLLGRAVDLAVTAGRARIRRLCEDAEEELTAPLPAVVSVVDGSNEPRYPTFPQVMAAKRKPFHTWNLDDLGLPPDTVGAPGAGVRLVSVEPARRASGRVVVDDGSGGLELARFLLGTGLVAERGAS